MTDESEYRATPVPEDVPTEDDEAFLDAITSSGKFTLQEELNMYGDVDEQTARELAREVFGPPRKETVDEPLLSSDVAVMAGRVCFASTRVPIEMVLASIDVGISWDRVLNAYPFMAQAPVDAARLHLAARDAQLRDDAVNALRGLEDFAAGRVLSENQLDDALGLKREPREGASGSNDIDGGGSES